MRLVATLCGYTEHELISNFDPSLSALVHKIGKSKEELIDELNRKYNGYFFGVDGCDISETVLNPFQVNCALSFQDVNEDYWSLS